MRKYQLPTFLVKIMAQDDYEEWLQRQAVRQVKRDRRRGNKAAKAADYKKAIHEAVKESNGVDAYSGEPLDWKLLGEYDNDASRQGRVEYKKQFALLPTMDHVE